VRRRVAVPISKAAGTKTPFNKCLRTTSQTLIVFERTKEQLAACIYLDAASVDQVA
jgi:hypothetical protein